MASTAPENDTAAAVLRRIRRIAAGSYAVFAIPMLVTGGARALLGLTCSAVVTMINFLWLEEIVESVLQPSPSLRPWRLFVRSSARFILLGAALAVIVVIARFNVVSVLLGFSIIVVGIMGEAAYTLLRGLE